MMTAQQGPGQPFDLHGCEGLGSRLMLGEEKGEGEEMGGIAGRCWAETVAVARAWRRAHAQGKMASRALIMVPHSLCFTSGVVGGRVRTRPVPCSAQVGCSFSKITDFRSQLHNDPLIKCQI